jgi:hypothetical protein
VALVLVSRTAKCVVNNEVFTLLKPIYVVFLDFLCNKSPILLKKNHIKVIFKIKSKNNSNYFY